MPYATKSNINDAEVREETYSEITENEITTATFLLNIDSLKQTYYITISWSDTVELYDDMTINCPPQSEMKYPETICYGMHNSTYSLNLYLPWKIESPYKNEYSYAVPEVYIDGDEINHTITAYIIPCNNLEENKKKANNYIKTIPGHDNYKIEYVVGDHVDVVCAEDL